MSSTISETRSVTVFPTVAEGDADHTLLLEAQAGNFRAFDRLVLKYRERVYSVVYNIIAHREDAADLTQEAIIKAYQSLSKFRGQSSFYTWLYRIAVNLSLNHLRRNRWKRLFSFEKLQEDACEIDCIRLLADERKVHAGLIAEEIQEKLNAALQKLSMKHRTVFVLSEIEQLSHAEIADIIQCSEGTVRSRLHYARQQLQLELKPYLD
jgi:RNA polymerase sigma-70 factor (ECF subfamily)